MRVIVVGGGPVGMFCAMAMARWGDEVTVVDRDPGPPESGPWARRGVMQFPLPHFFRPTVGQLIRKTLPDVWQAILDAGAVEHRPDGFPAEMAAQLTTMQCRRSTFERAIWAAAAREPLLKRRTGHADSLVTRGGRVTGVVVDGRAVGADLVIVAAGRASRVIGDARPPAEGGDCGFSYVARMYRARPGAQPPSSWLPMGAMYRGYLAIVFPQDDRTHSVLVVRPSSDHALALLRHADRFDAVAPLIPRLAPWVDADGFEPITGVMAGAGLTNSYRGQLDERGRAAASGVFFVGDAVCTTNPMAGRGITLGLRQADALLAMLAEGGDLTEVAAAFDAWCTDTIRPWYEDHVYWDATLLRRLAGADIDVEARIPSDVICAAADVDPSMRPAVGAFQAMQAPPSVLDNVLDNARAVLRSGWRPPYSDGPSRDELAAALTAAVSESERQAVHA
jgi:2-polyprenyl-6-methoxyphenol hydroxylase-like FAD-dependent oxidoreductase